MSCCDFDGDIVNEFKIESSELNYNMACLEFLSNKIDIKVLKLMTKKQITQFILPVSLEFEKFLLEKRFETFMYLFKNKRLINLELLNTYLYKNKLLEYTL